MEILLLDVVLLYCTDVIIITNIYSAHWCVQVPGVWCACRTSFIFMETGLYCVIMSSHTTHLIVYHAYHTEKRTHVLFSIIVVHHGMFKTTARGIVHADIERLLDFYCYL